LKILQIYLRVNPWAFLVVALSPLPFFSAVRQERPQNPLFLLSIAMLNIGSFFLFVDQENQLLVSNRWAWVAVLSAIILWLSIERLRNVEGARVSNAADSVVGLLGETITDIEPYSAGSVLVDGVVWQARSKEPIPAGKTVRVVRHDGFWLTVKKAEKLSKR
jgi:membrane-bound ClpP family serine protease